MRKGAGSSGRPVSGCANRGTRQPRRRDSVWLVTSAESNLEMSDHPHHTAGALALGDATGELEIEASIRRCTLIVERDPALAEALASSLQTRLDPAWSVSRISDIRLLASPSQSSVPDIIVFDANWPIHSGIESIQRLSELFDSHDALMIFVTTDTSYQLSQRGVMRGVVLREWRHPDDIAILVSEALADGQIGN